MTDFGQTRHCQ